eukprot:TRINITY_DN1143_c0_g1_i2.p1 TRINITY_DN1143_c0_g1~~TRINITY_DN1143_c0_g1_i2.p1  ORF type:complete len:1736 (+),score=493.70 TRINITY_DN1143_c0_g1_i2:112-5208(+)
MMPDSSAMQRRVIQGDTPPVKGVRHRVTSPLHRVQVFAADSDTSLSDDSDAPAPPPAESPPPDARQQPGAGAAGSPPLRTPDRRATPGSTPGSPPRAGPPVATADLPSLPAPPALATPGAAAQLSPINRTDAGSFGPALTQQGNVTPTAESRCSTARSNAPLPPLQRHSTTSERDTLPAKARGLQHQAKTWQASDPGDIVSAFEALVRTAAEVALKLTVLWGSQVPAGGMTRLDHARELLRKASETVATAALPEFADRSPTANSKQRLQSPMTTVISAGDVTWDDTVPAMPGSPSATRHPSTFAVVEGMRLHSTSAEGLRHLSTDAACGRHPSTFAADKTKDVATQTGGRTGRSATPPLRRGTQADQSDADEGSMAGSFRLTGSVRGAPPELNPVQVRARMQRGKSWFHRQSEATTVDMSASGHTDIQSSTAKVESPHASAAAARATVRAGGSFRRGPGGGLGSMRLVDRGRTAGPRSVTGRLPGNMSFSGGGGLSLQAATGIARVVAAQRRARARRDSHSTPTDFDECSSSAGSARSSNAPSSRLSVPNGGDPERQGFGVRRSLEAPASDVGSCMAMAAMSLRPPRLAGNLNAAASRGPLDSPRAGPARQQSESTMACNIDVLPFGEMLIPDPFDPDSRGVVRCPINDVHRYIGIFVIASSGEICFWNPKMHSVTGISEEEAWGNPITSFLLNEEEQQRMSDVIERAQMMTQEEAADYATPIPTARFSLACVDGVNRCVVTLSMVRSMVPSGEFLLALCHERMPVEARMDCVVWTLGALRRSVRKLEQLEGPVDLQQCKEMQNVLQAVQKLQYVCDVQGGGAARSWGKLSLHDMLGRLATDCHQEAADYGVTLHVADLPPDVPGEVQMDVRKLPQILAYLVHNAIRHSNQGMTVSVTVREESWEEEGEEVSTLVFEVRDTGCGMTVETMEMLFDSDKRQQKRAEQREAALARHAERLGPAGEPEPLPLVTVGSSARVEIVAAPEAPLEDVLGPRAETEHHGFGLVMVAIMIQELGGTIEVDSEVGEGSVFRVIVPLLMAEDPEVQAAPSPRGEQGEPQKELRIRCIVVEPNSVFRAALCHYLWGRKYAVTIAHGMDDVFADLAGTDLLLLSVDSVAEGRQGITDAEREQLLDRLKLFPDVRVVLTSNAFAAEMAQAIRACGMKTLVSPLKPGEVNRVLSEVEDLVREVRERNAEIAQVREAFEGGGMQKCPWERKKKLGTGSFGDVYEAINLVTQGRMAVKVMRIDEGNEQQALELLNEVRVMSKLHHPNIIHYFHTERAFQDGEYKLLIFMEFASGGTLKDKIPATGLPLQKAAGYTVDILTGLHYLHSKNIIHRDIKTANILIGHSTAKDEVCKLTDFGTAREVPQHGGEDQLARSLKGTPIFMAPEVINEIPYNWAADIWSVACLVMELVTGKPPWHHISENPWGVVRYVAALKDHGSEVFAGDGEAGVDIGPHQYHTHVRSFLRECLRVDPGARPSCETLLMHPFGSELNLSVSNPKALITEARRLSAHPRQSLVASGGAVLRKLAPRAAPAGRWGRCDNGSHSSGGDSTRSGFSGWGGASSAGSDGAPMSPPSGEPLHRAHPQRQRLSLHGGTEAAAGLRQRSKAMLGAKKKPTSGRNLHNDSTLHGTLNALSGAATGSETLTQSLFELHQARRSSRRTSLAPGRQQSAAPSPPGSPTVQSQGPRMSISGWG